MFEKGDDAPLLLKSSKSYKEVSDYYERTYRKSIVEVLWNYESLKGSYEHDNWNNALPENGVNAYANSGRVGRERLSSDPRGGRTNSSASDSGELNIEERTPENGSAFFDTDCEIDIQTCFLIYL